MTRDGAVKRKRLSVIARHVYAGGLFWAGDAAAVCAKTTAVKFKATDVSIPVPTSPVCSRVSSRPPPSPSLPPPSPPLSAQPPTHLSPLWYTHIGASNASSVSTSERRRVRGIERSRAARFEAMRSDAARTRQMGVFRSIDLVYTTPRREKIQFAVNAASAHHVLGYEMYSFSEKLHVWILRLLWRDAGGKYSRSARERLCVKIAHLLDDRMKRDTHVRRMFFFSEADNVWGVFFFKLN